MQSAARCRDSKLLSKRGTHALFTYTYVVLILEHLLATGATNPTNTVSCLAASTTHVYASVLNAVLAFSANSGDPTFCVMDHVNPITWLSVAPNHLCSATTKDLVAHQLTFLCWLNIHIRTLDFDAGSRGGSEQGGDAEEGGRSIAGRLYATLVTIAASLPLYTPLLNFTKECLFLAIKFVQLLGFAFAVVIPPHRYQRTIDVPLTFLRAIDITLPFPVSLALPIMFGLATVLLVGMSKPVLRRAFVKPSSRWVTLYGVIDFCVGVLLGPAFLPLANSYFQMWACAPALPANSNVTLADNDAACYSPTHLVSAVIGSIAALLYFSTALRLLRCSSQLAAIEGLLLWRRDIISSASARFEHPLTVVNSRSNKMGVFVGLILTLGAIIFGHSPLVNAIINTVASSMLILVAIRFVPYHLRSTNHMIQLLSVTTVYHAATAILVQEIGTESVFSQALPFTTFALLLVALLTKFAVPSSRVIRRKTKVGTAIAVRG